MTQHYITEDLNIYVVFLILELIQCPMFRFVTYCFTVTVLLI